MGRQLESYAEVVHIMRQMMGTPDAPIPNIIQNLQQMTGNALQMMDPNQVRTLLDRVKETGRAANISMDMMVELVKAGLATTKRERMVANGRQTDVVRVRITDAGRQALSRQCNRVESSRAVARQYRQRVT